MLLCYIFSEFMSNQNTSIGNKLWMHLWSAIAFITGRNRHHMKSNIRYKDNTNNTSVIIFFNQMLTQQKLPAMVLCLGEPPGRFLLLLLFIHFCSSFRYCSSFIFVLHFVVVVPHFISRLFSHVTDTTTWLLRPMKASTRSEFYPDYFWLLLVFHLPQALRFWVVIFLPTGVFYVMLLHRHFPASRQFFLEISRASYWSSKNRAGPSVCLIHSNPQYL